MTGLSVVILAAGQGKRMYSDLPKVLHPIGGRPLLSHVINAALELKPERTVVVYGHGGELVRERLKDAPVRWVEQEKQLGTGHAVEQAMPQIDDGETVLVLCGDVPLTDPETIGRLVELSAEGQFALLTVELDDPAGYGRIVRDSEGAVTAIVEHKDATPAQLEISEINTGILSAPAGRLRAWLKALENDNAQGEFYLTDVIGMAVGEGLTINTVHSACPEEVMGINDRRQLAELERCYQRNQAERLMLAGVTLLDPARLDIRGEVRVGRDVTIDVNVILEGSVSIGDGARIGANCVIKGAVIGAGCEILPNCVIETAIIGQGGRIGPFSRIRPETRLAEQVHVGNFVEIKKSEVGHGSKISHLSYIGDSEVGSGVNIGAGTITCNYDGAFKHKTIIGDNAFIGSDTQLVAPVTVGQGATIGAGSTITRDTPAEELTLSRMKQTTVTGWKRPKKGG